MNGKFKETKFQYRLITEIKMNDENNFFTNMLIQRNYGVIFDTSIFYSILIRFNFSFSSSIHLIFILFNIYFFTFCVVSLRFPNLLNEM